MCEKIKLGAGEDVKEFDFPSLIPLLTFSKLE